MKKVLIAALCVVSFSGFSQEDTTVQNSITGLVTMVQGQLLQLADAFDEDQYDWRPSEGIRSVREAILHTAAANYFLATKMGHPSPEGVDWMGMEKSITGKENVIAALKASNEFILGVIAKEEAAKYGEEVDFGFMKLNRLSGLLVVLDHNAEHKGQFNCLCSFKWGCAALEPATGRIAFQKSLVPTKIQFVILGLVKNLDVDSSLGSE